MFYFQMCVNFMVCFVSGYVSSLWDVQFLDV